ncbi:iron ABC transporter ATP-binding protein, partial [Cronobacter dublinensis subsp. dublinensis]|nr:iron ABC transporter ATP-binding protein [Cronobacter dublinensis subsp. dublinensis]
SVRHPLDGRSLRIFDVPRCA